MWLLFAFSGPVLWAISVHLDKYLVERFFKRTSVGVMLIFTAWIGVLLMPLIWLYQPAVMALPTTSIALMALSGLLYMGAMFLYLQALQNEEATVVAPFFQASPLFAYILGYFVLGEKLSEVQMLGGALIIGGALLLSVRGNRRRGAFKTRLVLLMLTCAMALAVSSLIFKIFAIQDEFWTTTFWMFGGEAVFGAGLLLIPSYRRQFMELLRTNTGALLAINGINELVNLGGGLSARYALLLAPLSLVQAIGSTTTLFVFLIGVALSVCCPRLAREDLSARNLLRKGISAVLITVGVILISR
jgi:drug/metabolite transporter (DMT)-like permease